MHRLVLATGNVPYVIPLASSFIRDEPVSCCDDMIDMRRTMVVKIVRMITVTTIYYNGDVAEGMMGPLVC